MTSFKVAYPYQQKVAELLLAGKNVILQAPTGAGKTHAALLPFLNAFEHNRDFPQRCIYSVPMRVLAKQFVTTYEALMKKAGWTHPLQVKIQTGEQPDDPELTANLIFATIDQTLSSYLLSPYSLGRNRANLNAGAVLSSYLVFDEFHLYDPASTLPTTLMMLRNFKRISPFVLMTATFSQVMLAELGDLLHATVFPATASERDQLDGLASQDKRRRYQVVEEPLSAARVLDAHDHRSLVICNTVDRARQLFDDLRANVPDDTEILLLHSRFLNTERNLIEDRIRDVFGKDADRKDGSVIVVATQAIEVGVDMSSAALHTELAPANALIQRAGRCARYQQDEGTVYIYWQTVDPADPATPFDLTQAGNAMPYKSQEALFIPTLNAFRARQGELKFAHEQEIITEVHNDQDSKILANIRAEGRGYATRVYAVQRGDARDDARHLIREIQQRSVIIHSDPNALLKLKHVSPLQLPAFGLHPGTLSKYVTRWLEAGQSLAWSVQFLHDEGKQPKEKEGKEDKDAEDAAQRNQERYRWQRVNNPTDANSASLVVVHPSLATYDLVRGFVPDQGGDWETPVPPVSDKMGTYHTPRYHLETYRDHIDQVYKAFLDYWWEAEWAAKKLEEVYGWPAGSVRRGAELAVLLHDVGKLSKDWQGWVHKYQNELSNVEDDISLQPLPGEAYAHTEFQTEQHQEIERRMKKRPWHAVEGAVSVAPVIASALDPDPLLYAVFCAIARHHSPYSEAHQSYRLIANAPQQIAAAFPDHVPVPDLSELITSGDHTVESDLIINPDGDAAAFLAYLLIVRALRRADVAGTKAGSRRL